LEKDLNDLKNYDVVLKKENENMFSFLKRVEHICNHKIDLLFINTIHETIFDLIHYLNFCPKSKMILTVHHVNAWLKPKLVCNIKHILRTIDSNLSSTLISRFIFPKFDAINVIYSPLREYIFTNTDYDKEVFTLPTSVFDNSKIFTKNQDNDGIVRVASPGLIQKHRKDYNYVISAFEALFKQFNENLELYMLGAPIGKYGKLVYNQLKKMKDEGCKVVIFDSFVPDEIFDEILNKCDVILAPIRIKTRADNEIEEAYGTTVGSGVIFNAVLYAKPIILPREFNMLKELNSSSLKYSNEKELEEIITELIFNPKKLEKLKKEALVNSQKLSLESLQKYFEENILYWLKNS
jgi:hypothetical protein